MPNILGVLQIFMEIDRGRYENKKGYDITFGFPWKDALDEIYFFFDTFCPKCCANKGNVQVCCMLVLHPINIIQK